MTSPRAALAATLPRRLGEADANPASRRAPPYAVVPRTLLAALPAPAAVAARPPGKCSRTTRKLASRMARETGRHPVACSTVPAVAIPMVDFIVTSLQGLRNKVAQKNANPARPRAPVDIVSSLAALAAAAVVPSGPGPSTAHASRVTRMGLRRHLVPRLLLLAQMSGSGRCASRLGAGGSGGSNCFRRTSLWK